MDYLTPELRNVVKEFEEKYGNKAINELSKRLDNV